MTEQVFASTDRAQLASIIEATLGVTPDTPTMRKHRATSYALNPEKRVVTSREIRADAMLAGSAVVGRSTTGTFDFELSLGGDFDEVIEAVLRGTYQVNLDLSSVAVIAGNKFQKTGAFANAVVGQRVYASGFVQGSNTGWHTVTGKTNDDITVSTVLTAEPATAGTRVRGKNLRNGVVKRAFSFEQAFLDVNAFLMYRGARYGNLNLQIEAEQIIRGSGSMMGMTVQSGLVQFAGAYTAPTTAEIVTASENLGDLTIDGVPISTAIRSVNFTINDNLRMQTAAGEQYPVGIAYGTQEITGRLEVYFKDRTMFDTAQAHTSFGLALPMRDPAGRGLHVFFPNVKLGAPQQPVSGVNADVMQTFDFQAFPDVATNTYQVQMDVAHG